MDLRNLQTFIQVAELGSFTRAGEVLGYSQPTVSFQIKQLESELGAPLFERIGKTVTLTESGRTALRYAQQICRTADEMVTGEQSQEPRGVIRLAMADSLCLPLIGQTFAEFRRTYPLVSLKVIAAGTTELFRLLDHNEVDLVCTLDQHFYDTDYLIPSEERVNLHFVCATDHPLADKELTIADLQREPFLLTEKGMSYRRLLDEELAKHSVKLDPVLESGNADLLCRLVADGVGISFLPDYVTEHAVKEGRIRRMQVKNVRIDLWKQILYHKDKWISAPMQAMLSHLSATALG